MKIKISLYLLFFILLGSLSHVTRAIFNALGAVLDEAACLALRSGQKTVADTLKRIPLPQPSYTKYRGYESNVR